MKERSADKAKIVAYIASHASREATEGTEPFEEAPTQPESFEMAPDAVQEASEQNTIDSIIKAKASWLGYTRPLEGVIQYAESCGVDAAINMMI